MSGIGNGQEGTHLIVLDVRASDLLCTKSLTQRGFGKQRKGARRILGHVLVKHLWIIKMIPDDGL